MNEEDKRHFEDELYEHFKNMKVENKTFHVKIVSKLIQKHWNDDKFINVLRDKLDSLFNDRTEELIEIICSYFNITKPLYNTDDETNEKDKDSVKEIRNRFLKNRNGVRRNKLKAIRPIQYKWNDIASCVKSNVSSRRLEIECSDYLNKGVCSRGDTCKFQHPKASLICPSRSTFNSKYDGISATNNKSAGYSFILPKQKNVYDNMPNLCCNLTLSDTEEQDDIEEIHSNYIENIDEDDEPIVTHASPPKYFEPPSLLDTPLWYKELGLVEEACSSSESSAISNHCNGDGDSQSQVQTTPIRRHRCLLVYNIPSELNTIGALNKHFRKFGVLRNISVSFHGDSSRALVEFRLSKDMHNANKSPEAVIGNRFIKTRPYKKRQESCSKKNKKLKKSYEGKRKGRSNPDRRKNRERRRDRSYSRSINNSRRRSSSRVDRYGREKSWRLGGVRDADGCSHRNEEELREDRNDGVHSRLGRSNITGDFLHVPKTKDEFLSDDESSHIAQTTDSLTADQLIIVKEEHIDPIEPERNDDCITEETTVEMSVDSEPVTAENDNNAAPLVQDQEQSVDLKLERALNDSDVDSVDSGDTIVQTRRRYMLAGRRKQLQSSESKNGKQLQLERVRASLQFYKTLLESQIIKFKKVDRSGKEILGPQIKLNHEVFLGLKERCKNLVEQLKIASPPKCRTDTDSVCNKVNKIQENDIKQLEHKVAHSLVVNHQHQEEDHSAEVQIEKSHLLFSLDLETPSSLLFVQNTLSEACIASRLSDKIQAEVSRVSGCADGNGGETSSKQYIVRLNLQHWQTESGTEKQNDIISALRSHIPSSMNLQLVSDQL